MIDYAGGPRLRGGVESFWVAELGPVRVARAGALDKARCSSVISLAATTVGGKATDSGIRSGA